MIVSEGLAIKFFHDNASIMSTESKRIWKCNIYYAFLRRIQKEKKQMYVKYKSTEQFGILDEADLMGFDDVTVKPFEMYDNISEFIENFEENKKKKKAAKKTKGLEKFLE